MNDCIKCFLNQLKRIFYKYTMAYHFFLPYMVNMVCYSKLSNIHYYI